MTMYVCMYVLYCMYDNVCNVCIMNLQEVCVCMSECMYVCMYVRTYVYDNVCMCVLYVCECMYCMYDELCRDVNLYVNLQDRNEFLFGLYYSI